MDINKLISRYSEWIKSEITYDEFENCFELTLPFLDRFNDYIQVYVKEVTERSFILTDDGYTLSNLFSSGVIIEPDTVNKQLLDTIVMRFGLSLEDKSIVAKATYEDFPIKLHDLIQAIVLVDDLYQPKTRTMANLIAEETKNFFVNKNIYFSRDIGLKGKTGNHHYYDYLLQRTAKRPDRFCKTINTLNDTQRDLTIFNWLDSKEIRKDDSRLIVLLNDENTIKDEDIKAFKSYDIESVPFKKINDYMNLFLPA